MTLDSFENILKQLNIYVEQKLQHTYIDKHIEKPYIDEIKLALLAKLFKYAPVNEPMQKDYIVSTMLIQIAADTHELVSTASGIEREKQLLVLAGDYYSGLHYLLLAKTGDFSLIKRLATTVKKINELKMELYYEDNIDFVQLIALQKQIHSLITINVMELYTDFSIHPFIEDIILASQLIFEKQLMTRHNEARLLNKLINETSYYALINKLEKKIENLMVRLESYLEDPTMKQTLTQLQFDQLYKRLIKKHCSFVEEGNSYG